MYLSNIDRDKLVAAAGGDPWEVNATIQRGRLAQIDRLAQAFTSAGRSAAAAGDDWARARERFEQAWDRREGDDTLNDSARVLLASSSLDVQSARATQIAADLQNVAALLADAQRNSASRISDLEEQLARTDAFLAKLIGGAERTSNTTDSERSQIGIHLGDLDQKAVEDTNAALRHLVQIRDGYADVLRDAQGRLRNHGYDLVVSEAPDRPALPGPAGSVLPIPSPGTDPEAVSKWWCSLAGEEKTALIAEHSPELGNLNGIPVDVRSQANQAVLSDDLNRVSDLANRRGVPVDDVLADPPRYGLLATDVCRYTNACRTQHGLAASAQAEDEHDTNPQVYLLKYQPEAFGGDGAAAIAMGNPDTAANTAVLVKGMGSGVRQGTLANPDGRRLYREANCADWIKDTAVVMWVGYDAPNSPADPTLYEPNLARAGGRALAGDVNALAITHQGTPAHMTVVGHSYGSTTVADAAAGFGMRAHDVVLLGCPGTDLARSAADFHLPEGGHVFVGDASQDEVSWFGHDTMATPFGGVGLGEDPAMGGYGSTRFKAEVVGYSTNPFSDHSHYFDDGSESLFSLGDVVSCHGDDLQRDHMTARHRGEYGLPAIVEPEAVRQATTGHRHSAPPR